MNSFVKIVMTTILFLSFTTMANENSDLSGLGLSNQTINALKNADITSRADLLKMTYEKLRRLTLISDKRLQEIRDAFADMGEKISGDPQNSEMVALQLSPRTFNALRNGGIDTIEDLITRHQTDPARLARLPNMGPKGIFEINLALGKLGLTPDVNELQQIGLNARAINALLESGITSLEQLKKITIYKLMLTPNLSKGTVEHIVQVLAQKNIRLYDDDLHKAVVENNVDLKLSYVRMGFSHGLGREFERIGVKTVGDLMFLRNVNLASGKPFNGIWLVQYDELVDRIGTYLMGECQLKLL